MTRRPNRISTSSKRSKYSDKVSLRQFRDQYPHAVEQISKLEPLRSNPRKLNNLLIKLESIVRAGKARSDKDYLDLMMELIRSSDVASFSVGKVIAGIGHLEEDQCKSIFSLVNHEGHKLFSLAKSLEEFLDLLAQFQEFLSKLHKATKMVTGISDVPRERGRPGSPYWQTARKLIAAWEATISPWGGDSRYLGPGRPLTPVPKKLRAKYDARFIMTKQPSTEFFVIALRLIYPNIKDAEAFTAVKKALKLRFEPRQRLFQIELFLRGRPHELTWSKAPF